MRLKTHILVAAAFLGAFLASTLATCQPVAALASRNSSGTFSLYTPGNPVTTHSTISSSWANNTLSDMGTEITNSLDRNGRGPMLAQLQAYAGSVSAPGLSFSSDSNSGLYRAGSHDLRMSINGADVGKWTSSGLLVTGSASATTDVVADSPGANAGTVTASMRFGSATSGEAIASKRTSTGNQFGLDFYTGSAQVMSLTNTGGVEIPGSTATHPGTAFTASYGKSTVTNPGSLTPGLCNNVTGQPLTGVTTGGVCSVSTDSPSTGILLNCAVTGADTIEYQVCNVNAGGTYAPGNINLRIRVWQP